jgi:hypothetical protein
MFMRSLVFLAAALASISIQAFGGDGNVVEKPMASDSIASFEKQSAHIHEQMKPGGIYEHISNTDKVRVDTRLGDMQKMLEAHPTQPVNDWQQSEKIALFNTQEEVNGILKHNDNNRLICERHAPVGSNVPVTTCDTYGELAERRSHSQKFLTDRSMMENQKAGAVDKPKGGN